MFPDDRVPNSYQMDNATMKQSQALEDFVLTIPSKKEIKLVDYIKKRFLFETKHIVSDEIKEMIETEQKIRNMRAIFVIGDNIQKTYWEINCEILYSSSKQSLNDLKNITINKSALKNVSMFAIKMEKQEFLIFHYLLAEKILSQCPLGIRFEPIMITASTK